MMLNIHESTDDYRLGYAPIDEVHQEFLTLVARLRKASDPQFPDLMVELVDHAHRHFGEEDKWMTETQFPPRDCHIQEHAAVLASITDVQQRLANGDVSACRSLANALHEWFPGHATHLDSALAHWMVKRRFGGKPIVLRRAVAM